MSDADDGDDMNRAKRVQERRTSRRDRGRQRGSQMDNTSNTSGSSDVSEASVASDIDETSGSDVTDERSESDETDNSTAVRDQTHVAMYLEEELAEDLDLRFTELKVQYQKKDGEKIEKNRDFYPALARSAVNDTTLTEELGLAKDDEET